MNYDIFEMVIFSSIRFGWFWENRVESQDVVFDKSKCRNQVQFAVLQSWQDPDINLATYQSSWQNIRCETSAYDLFHSVNYFFLFQFNIFLRWKMSGSFKLCLVQFWSRNPGHMLPVRTYLFSCYIFLWLAFWKEWFNNPWIVISKKQGH